MKRKQSNVTPEYLTYVAERTRLQREFWPKHDAGEVKTWQEFCEREKFPATFEEWQRKRKGAA